LAPACGSLQAGAAAGLWADICLLLIACLPALCHTACLFATLQWCLTTPAGPLLRPLAACLQPRSPVWVFDPTLGILVDSNDLATPPYAYDPHFD
jgi:hypothetical protein